MNNQFLAVYILTSFLGACATGQPSKTSDGEIDFQDNSSVKEKAATSVKEKKSPSEIHEAKAPKEKIMEMGTCVSDAEGLIRPDADLDEQLAHVLHECFGQPVTPMGKLIQTQAIILGLSNYGILKIRDQKITDPDRASAYASLLWVRLKKAQERLEVMYGNLQQKPDSTNINDLVKVLWGKYTDTQKSLIGQPEIWKIAQAAFAPSINDARKRASKVPERLSSNAVGLFADRKEILDTLKHIVKTRKLINAFFSDEQKIVRKVDGCESGEDKKCILVLSPKCLQNFSSECFSEESAENTKPFLDAAWETTNKLLNDVKTELQSIVD